MYINTNAYRSGTISDLNRDNSVALMLRTKIGALASCVNVISAISEMVHKEAMPFISVSDKSMMKNKTNSSTSNEQVDSALQCKHFVESQIESPTIGA